jgi:spore maturation protein CgeB/Tfp pilus assembly protein PilF/ubiquinone/menaquinone biosynthesis C-methylase UbiE
MFSPLKILTFNWHEAYIHLLARTGFTFVAAEPESGGAPRKWNVQCRPVPDNVSIATAREWQDGLENGTFDLVIAHNPVNDLVHLVRFDVPKILVLHNRLSTSLALGNNEDNMEEYRERILNRLFASIPNLRFVFISETKCEDWGLDGAVIGPGIDPEEYGEYRGEVPRVLRVGNEMKQRDLMMGYSHQEAILRGLPSTVLGTNLGVPSSRPAESFDHLREHYRSHRLFLNTTVDGREDGYNLAMLEAMATGMPVVSTANATSPIVDGVNGYVSRDMNELHERIRELLADREEAYRLGEKARQTVYEQFSINEFLEKWREEIREAVAAVAISTGSRKAKEASPGSAYGGAHGTAEIKRYEFDEDLLAAIPGRRAAKIEPRDLSFGPAPKRRNILLCYAANPTTTAYFLERALRKRHNVLTCGPTISDETLTAWDMLAVKERVEQHDVDVPWDSSMGDITRALPGGFEPELLLWVESGVNFTPPDLASLECPRACYLIDSHINLEWHLKWAQLFDFVFVAQKRYIPRFEEAGCREVHWLPLACDPELHRRHSDVEKKHDVGFVGSLTEGHARRVELLRQLSEKSDVHKERCFLEDMVRVLNESRIVFNSALANDMNMRVFEALGCGSLLVTDRAEGSGLEEFFRDGEHLVIYDDSNLADKVQYYLEREDLREKVARQGREEVLARHTYEHRAAELERVIFSSIERSRDAAGRRGPYEPGGYAGHAREEIAALVPQSAASILDVGCAAGETGRLLKELGFPRVVGIERDPESVARAREVLDDVIVGDVERMDLPFERGSFDCIIFADVLEHLIEPGDVLRRFRDYLSPQGVVIASIPNVRNFLIIHNLVEGYWRYTDEGILDRTHLRFFTLTEIKRMFDAADYEIVKHATTIHQEFKDLDRGPDGTFSFGRVTVRGLNEDDFRDLLVFQHIVTARRKVDDPVSSAKEKVDAGQLSEAMAMLQSADIPAADRVDSLILQGECLAKLERLAEAEAKYRAAISEEPLSDRAVTGLGAVFVLQDRHDDALDAFRQAAELNPESDKALCGIGLALWAKGEAEEALVSFAAALDVNFENMAALMNIVHVSYELGTFELAEKHLKNFLEYYPANFDVLFILAGVLYKAGDYDGARGAIDTILTLEPQRKYARELLDKINATDRNC